MKSGDLVFLDTAEGSELFHSAEVKNHFWSVGRYFETQLFLTYCGIASSVTVLNSLAIDAPEDPQIYPYTMFTQENIFTHNVLQRRRPLDVEMGGNTLEQLADILDALDVEVETYFGADYDLNRCREILIESLQHDGKRIILDFNRRVFNEEGAGHFSPVAAYHRAEDRFLVMDVARFKLPPCWVKAELLHDALVEIDPTSQKSRGFLTVAAKERSGTA